MSDLSSITAETPLILIGCGKMGGAMLKGWLARGLSAKAVHVVDPAPGGVPDGIKIHDSLAAVPGGLSPAVIVLAVKPQMMGSVLPHLETRTGPGTLVLSIAAGIRKATLEDAGAPQTPVVRAMPNTPAAIGKGISGARANAHVDKAGRALADALLGAVGDVIWLSSEDLIDAVTSVSGSGPAYFFYMVEALAEAGLQVGLAKEDAERLARATFTGAAALLEESGEDPRTLRRNVTSPGGTTEAALDILTGEEGLARIMRRAVRAARDRGRELGQE